jgi:hypothetical protein
MKKQVLQKTCLKESKVFLKYKKDVNALMHVLRKQIPMLMTFDM